MQHPPDVDVVQALDAEGKIGVTGQRPRAQARQVQLVGVAQRAGGWVAADVVVGLLQDIDEAHRCLLRTLGK